MALNVRRSITTIGIWGILVAGAFAIASPSTKTEIPITPAKVEASKVVCTNQEVPFTVTNVENAYYYKGVTIVSTKGENGVRHVCKDSVTNAETSNTVTKAPIAQINTIGTAEEVEEDIAPSWAMTVCNDGTYSASVGRGTCSWHDGIAYYL